MQDIGQKGILHHLGKSVIKPLALPMLIHSFPAWSKPPKHTLNEINRLFKEIIWVYNTEREKRNALISIMRVEG
jgi:hypothetical protein